MFILAHIVHLIEIPPLDSSSSSISSSSKSSIYSSSSTNSINSSSSNISESSDSSISSESVSSNTSSSSDSSITSSSYSNDSSSSISSESSKLPEFILARYLINGLKWSLWEKLTLSDGFYTSDFDFVEPIIGGWVYNTVVTNTELFGVYKYGVSLRPDGSMEIDTDVVYDDTLAEVRPYQSYSPSSNSSSSISSNSDSSNFSSNDSPSNDSSSSNSSSSISSNSSSSISSNSSSSISSNSSSSISSNSDSSNSSSSNSSSSDSSSSISNESSKLPKFILVRYLLDLLKDEWSLWIKLTWSDYAYVDDTGWYGYIVEPIIGGWLCNYFVANTELFGGYRYNYILRLDGYIEIDTEDVYDVNFVEVRPY